jgi:hypothetical protein
MHARGFSMSDGPMSQQLPASDKVLADSAARGDQAAFVALYDRLFEDVYDFLLRLLLSRRRVAPAILSTFIRLRRRLVEGRWRGNPRLAVLAAAYQAAMEEGGVPAAAVAAGEKGEESLPFVQVDPGKLASPGETARAQEEAPIIWEAAASLDRTEYALLDLNLRRGLNAAQAGQVVAMGRLKAGSMISRLRRAAEEAFTSILMLRLGRRQCAELDRLAASMERAILPPESRHLVSDHVIGCLACSETRRRLVPPLKVLAAFRPVPPAPGVKEAVLQDLLAYTSVQAGPDTAAAARPAPPWPASMAPPPQPPHGPSAVGGSAGGPAFAILVGAAALLALPVAALALWLTVLSGDNGNGSAGAGPTSTASAAALEGCDIGGPGTPGWITCTPTATPTVTSTPTSAPATSTALPTGTVTPSPTAPPTETPTMTPVAQETPMGIVETATPAPSPSPHATPSAVPSPSPAHSPSPSPQPSP